MLNKYCTNCGMELAEGAHFCSGCGINLKEDDDQVKNTPYSKNKTLQLSLKTVVISGIILVLLIGGMLFYLLTDNTEEDIAIGVGKGYVYNFFMGMYFVTPNQFDVTFSDIEVEHLEDKKDYGEGEYEVTGRITYISPDTEEEEEADFTANVAYENGAYALVGGKVDLQE
ncbi:zinc-ribbon domain-containing protein [Salirhabdus sp. Marseille-P4669]|uniref:zinc-ribbon domain-containing protein n=1 Tax=Salirhabdus sp. Marseille-P4669 TaxID=2042310 RepID=UPI000C7A8EE0|nr:zinc ribbon domain-containing protein [Salirhabdus sp. Marseille-P4669]